MGLYSFLLALFLFPLATQAAIIGTDDRKDLYQVGDPRLRQLALSAAAVLFHRDRHRLIPTATGYELSPKVKTHREAEQLCSDQRFLEQPTPGYCSAFLVGPDRLATVAHCVDKRLENMQAVFHFALTSAGGDARHFTRDDVYSIRSIVKQSPEMDWAILSLDRPVVGHEFFRLHTAGMARIGDPVAVIGFPSGLPLKIADNATVLEALYSNEDQYFEANLDVFGGSSGAPVVNLLTYEVEGLLAVAFGEHESEHPIENGKPCTRMRHMADLSTAAPAWVVRASLIPQGL